MRTRACICITLLAFWPMQFNGQPLTMQFPEGTGAHAAATHPNSQSQKIAQNSCEIGMASNSIESAPAPGGDPLNSSVDGKIPIAQPVPLPPTGTPVTIRAEEQERHGSVYVLRGEVEIDYKNYVVRADRITYDTSTGVITAEGHLQLQGGPDDEEISASHGVINLDKQTGRFYDVIGSVGLRRFEQRTLYTTANPLTITARELIKSGPEQYEAVGGSVTSCRLPDPHWRIVAPRIAVANGRAEAWNSNFRLLGYPILYLPYVTHSVNVSGRQSGFLIPQLQTGSSIKGTVIGDSFYWAINRSMDLTLGLRYYSLRGFGQSAEFRYRGRGNDFAEGRYNGLEDRGIAPLYVNQGGQDTFISARHDFNAYTRAVTNAEYLSSYAFRQVFSENFSQAVSSEVKSWGFATREKDGLAASFDLERYQNFSSAASGDQIRLLHLPTLEFDAVDRRLGRSPVLAGGVASFSLLSRSEPYYRSHNVGRTDLYPHFSIPWIVDGWTFRPEVGLRETWYSHSQSLGPVPPPPSPPQSTFFPSEDAVPITENASLNRKAVELDLQILPPVLTRDFHEQYLGRRFGVAIRHAIEPEINYRYVAGVNKFNQAPRFDPIDIYSDTNEVEYGLTQRLFLKRLRRAPCPVLQPASQPDQAKRQESCGSSSRQWLSWFLGQKYFADPTFGGAVIAGRRNIFASTLNFSGVDYITAPRSLSPIVSRLRIHPGSNLDIEWDYDYDTKKGRAAASNIFANFRKGNFFSSFGSALLNAVGETPVPPNQPQNVVKYDQLQFLAGYGSLTKPGLSGAFSGGVDLHSRSLEYTAVQATYNFDCCGFTAEYRQFHLGQIRNESQETFSFTLAGVGAAGNLKRAERLF